MFQQSWKKYVKSLGREYARTLSDKCRKKKIMKQTEYELTAIDSSKLPASACIRGFLITFDIQGGTVTSSSR